MNELGEKQKKIGIILAVMASIAIFSVSISFVGETRLVELFGIKIMNSSLMGTLESIVSLLAIMMVCIDFRVGRFTGIFVIMLFVTRSIASIVRTSNYTPLPGLMNGLISIFSILLISTFFSKAEKAKYTDALTGVYNKEGFVNEIDRLIDKGRLRHVIYIKVKNFRSISDRLGHDYGDSALKVISKRLKETVGNDGIVCRVDGTEFAIAIYGYINVNKLCKRIVDRVSENLTFVVNEANVNCYLNAYVGVTSYPMDAEDSKTLLKYADIAMYNATQKHGEKIGYFDSAILDTITKHIEMIRLIKDGLRNKSFYLVYQPQFMAKDKKLRGFEALIRCKLPDGTIVSPGEFIPVAERTDLIQSIDEYVLERAMCDFKPVLDEKNNKCKISVNVSAKSISDKNFVDKLAIIMEKTGFPSYALEIEITEYSLAGSKEQTIKNIYTLRKLGIQIALDDFGTGYTSLSQLVNLPINVLKIDKSLVDDINKTDSALELIDAVIYMGHLMQCEIVSEGVEDEKQLEILQSKECDYIQGYLWGKPLDYNVAVELIK